MITENIFIPFKTADLNIFASRKVLVLIPHQDDETFGCGGTLTKIRPLVHKIDFCLITDGSKSDDAVSVETRDSELDRVANILNVSKIIKLKIPDRDVFNNQETISNHLKSMFEHYDIIFTPNLFDMHPDHRYLANIVTEMVLSLKFDITLFFYEVTMPQVFINFLVDITDVIDKKMKLISEYHSQLNLVDYDEKIILINKIRTLGVEDIEYAEGFYMVKGYVKLAEYLNEIKKVICNNPKW